MSEFLRNLKLDQLSFWLGFFAGSIFWLLMRVLTPSLAQLRAKLQERAKSTRVDQMTASEIRLNNDTLRYVQGMHLAAPMFALDEVLIPPRLLAPPIPPDAQDVSATSVDVTDWAIPYLPDWPELGSYYGAPTLTLLEALQANANIAVIGQPGAGKTVALAHLATQIIRRQDNLQALENMLPLFIRASELLLPPRAPDNPLLTLQDALSGYLEAKTKSKLDKVLLALFEQKRIVLIVDGLDELSPAQMDPVVEFLGSLAEKYPGVRMVTSASAEYLGKLPNLGFYPLAVAAWSEGQRAAFIRQWGTMWSKHIAPAAPAAPKSATPQKSAAPQKGQPVTPPPQNLPEPSNPLLLTGWLLNGVANLNPLEVTLKVWAAFAGDALGAAPRDAVEAHIRRLLHNQPPKNRAALEKLAAQMITNMLPIADRAAIESWIGEQPIPGAVPTEDAGQPAAKGKAGKDKAEAPKIPSALPPMITAGLVNEHSAERYSIAHPLFAGYLASLSLGPMRVGEDLAAQPAWSGRLTTLGYMALADNQPAFLNILLEDIKEDILLRGLFSVAHWLRDVPEGAPWTNQVLRMLATYLQKDDLPLAIRARAMLGLVYSGNSAISTMVRQMLQSPQAELRQLAALGSGILRDPKLIPDLIRLQQDKTPGVMQAAVLALVALNDKGALEAVADGLLTGDENLRRAAAESLANNVEEGYPTLEEASALEDPSVRRAAVFGLNRIHQDWAMKILEKIRKEDAQWVVQDAAIQALSAMSKPNPRQPRPLPALTMTPWLIAYAGELGMGVAPGKPAYDLLYRAIREGKEEQQLAAINYLTWNTSEASVLPLYNAYFANFGEVREATFNALWHTAAAGVRMPPPEQFGLG